MSFGIIGITTPCLKIANGVQKVNKVHVYDAHITQQFNMFNAENYACLADLMVNMNRPRTIVTSNTETKKTIDQILEWSDPEDTIVNCGNDHFKHDMFYENECLNKDVHYLSATLSNDAFVVGGKEGIFRTHEPLFYTFAKNVAYAGDLPGSGHFAKMILDTFECMLYHIVSDVVSYCNGNIPVSLGIMNKAATLDLAGPIIENSKSHLYVTRNYKDTAEIKNTTAWFLDYALGLRVPTPVAYSAINARVSSQYTKHVNAKQSYNKFFEKNVILQTMRFCFSMAYYECIHVSNGKVKAWIKNSNVECPLFDVYDPLEVMDATVEKTRKFVTHSVYSGIPTPTIQAALSQYDFMKQERTSMNFIASIKDV